VGGALLDLEGHVLVDLQVPGQPHGGEVPPPQLLNDHISVYQYLSDVGRVVPSDLIVRDSFILTLITICKSTNEFFSKY